MHIIFQAALNIAFLIVFIFAVLGAIDYVVDSVRIFIKALRRYRERNGRD